MNRYRTFSIPCPFGDGEDCPNTLTGTVNSGSPRTFDYPGDPPEIEDVTGCVHVDDLFDDDRKYEQLVDCVVEQEYQSSLDQIDREIDRFMGK